MVYATNLGHRFDCETPIEETVSVANRSVRMPVTNMSFSQMQALHDVVKAGYVRYIGMSSCYAYQCKSLRSSSVTLLTHVRTLR